MIEGCAGRTTDCEPCKRRLKRRIAGIEVVLSAAGRAVISGELRVVVALEGFGELVEELNQFGGRLIGEIDRQTHEWQVVRLEHSV